MMLRACLAMTLSAAAFAVQAQNAELLPNDATAAALKCLVVSGAEDSKLQYPASELPYKKSGVVRMSLEFTDPERPPATGVLHSGSEVFQDAVERHVRRYRLPCLTPSLAPLRVTQEFHFVWRAGTPVTWVSGGEVVETPGCQIEGIDASRIRYPEDAMRRDESGTVLVKMRFDAPGKPSEVVVLNKIGSRHLERAAKHIAGDARLSCGERSGPWPVDSLMPVAFRLAYRDSYVFKDLSLRQFVEVIDGLERHRVRFDLNSMGCPFQAKVTLYQPYVRNNVAQVGEPNPNRLEFLRWLSTVALRIPPETLKEVLGDTIVLSVPCGSLDLTS